MHKVLIVEDEMLVRLGLKNSVDWSRFGMEVAADVPDGQAAWDFIQRENPDVVITDIRMPRMDGMELIERIRERDKRTRIVVLSCLEEFDLARKAMTLGVSNYILKLTMTEEEISNVLNGVSEELGRLNGKSETAGGAGDLPANLELVKEKMLKDFLFYGIFSPDEFGSFVQRSGMRLSPVRLQACVMELDRYSRIKQKFKDEHGHLVKMSLLNVLSEILASRKRGEAFHLDDNRYLLLFSYGDLHSEQSIQAETGAILQQIQDVIRTYFNGTVSFGISAPRSGYASLPSSHAEAQQALGRKFLAGPGQLHATGGKRETSGYRGRLAAMRRYEPIRSLLPKAKQEEYERYLELIEEQAGDRKAVTSALFQFVQWIATQMYDSNQNERALLYNITERLEDSDTLPGMLDETAAYVAELAKQAHERLQMSDEIAKAIQYVKLHYADNISLQTVADYVDLSSGYLSNLFRKELQITFIDYLNRYRIERAKELMATTSKKSSDIAVEVGFSPEYTYFSKVFKKVTGLNPNEYRREWLAGAKADT
ncbi:response regulator [Cohnella thailandensis]|uniref:Response regulator n=1 Tax=Cohnella thailandensis TaxID=557557 RepID=A0A841T452_9BACL|nr:response regulator [Cohnella thailandensis]MBB6635901.1 response regulator [Cohnella thailandensis]MBP1976279.1 YesN/AraC family two-component response regulator [Cohnella thailandensis]